MDEDYTKPRKKASEWKQDKKTPDFLYTGAKVLAGWADDTVVTEGDYDDAIERFGGVPMGYDHDRNPDEVR